MIHSRNGRDRTRTGAGRGSSPAVPVLLVLYCCISRSGEKQGRVLVGREAKSEVIKKSLVVRSHHLAVFRDLLKVRLQRPNQRHHVVGLLLRDAELGEHRVEGLRDDVEVFGVAEIHEAYVRVDHGASFVLVGSAHGPDQETRDDGLVFGQGFGLEEVAELGVGEEP